MAVSGLFLWYDSAMVFLALIYLAFICLGLPDSLLGSSWPLMRLAFSVPAGYAGFVSVTISCCTILSSLLAHRLIRRIGTGGVTMISIALTAGALLGFSLSPGFFWLLLFAVPLGLGAGAVDSGLNAFVAEHYQAKHMNWLHCFWGVGAMLGPALISLLSRGATGWRGGYFWISLILFFLAGCFLFSLRAWRKIEASPVPATGGTPRDPGETEKSGRSRGLFSPLRMKGGVYALGAFFLYTSIENSFMLWGASYLVAVKAVAPSAAAGWVSLFFFGVTLGRFAGGFLSMKMKNPTMIRGGILVLMAGLLIMIIPGPAYGTLFAFGLIGLGLAPIFPAMLHQTPVNFGLREAKAAMGLQMASAYAGITLMPPLFGGLFQRTSFVLMPGLLLACALGLFFCTGRLNSGQDARRAENR